jgi:hypothetical protein
MKRFLLLTGLLVSAFFANAQTVDEVIAKYMDAMGGKDKLNSIQSLHLVGISTAPNGNEITADIWKVNNKLYRRSINFGMGSSTTLLTDKGGWQTNFRNGGAWEAMPEQQRNNQLYEMDCTGPLVDYATKGHKAELIGKETIDGKESFHIKLTTKEGRELNFYIDTATHYINRLSYKGRGRPGAGGAAGEETEIGVNFTNYDKTPDGFIFAFSQTITGGFAGTMTFEKIEVNPQVDDKLYKAE